MNDHRKDHIDWQAIDRLLEHPNENFVDLAKAANLDPATDFIHADLRFVDFGKCNLEGYDFRNANLEGADLSKTSVDEECLCGARNLDKAILPVGIDPRILSLEEGSTGFQRSDPAETARRQMSEALSISRAMSDPHVFSEAPVYDVMLPDSGPEFAFAEDQAPFQHPSSVIDYLPIPPPGWIWIDKAWLEQQRQPLDDNELGRFFDGVPPQWRHASSDKIPRRDVVLEASALLQEAAAEPGRPRVIFLEGAGGEGKSTAFRQIVARLLEDDPRWAVLWRENDLDSMVLPKHIIGGLPKDGRPILIATDEAHNIARNLLTFVEETRARDVGGVHVLIAARDTDWRAAGPLQPRWEEITDFEEKRLRGVTSSDAGKIIDAWAAAGGLGDLTGLARQEAIRRFKQMMRDQGKNRGGAPLLGVRIEFGMVKGLRLYVGKLLRHLDGMKAPGGSLKHAFAYVAAMHAENLEFLTPSVLAYQLGCDEAVLRREVIRPLASAFACDVQSDVILARHKRIAETALELLEEEGEDRFEMLAELAVAAVRAYVAGNYVRQLASWRFGIVNQMLKKRRLDQAVRLVRRLVELEPHNIHHLVNLARTLRETGNVEAAFAVFRSAPDAITRDRVFYYKWSTAAGNAGDYALNVWLAGVSLSDADGLPRLDAERVKLSLAGFGVACKELYGTSGEKTFLRARASAGQLGLRIPSIERDARASGFFRRHRDETDAEGIEAMSVEAALQAIEDAVLRAFDLSDVAEDLADEGVPYRDEIYFKSLRDFPWREG